MHRPSWLHWQPIRGSAWLVTAMLVIGLPPIAYSLARDWPRLADKSPDEAAHFVHQYMYEASPAVLIYALLAQASLLWFTYFSGSPRVKESDKFAVFLMLCGSAIGWLLMLLRAVTGNFGSVLTK